MLLKMILLIFATVKILFFLQTAVIFVKICNAVLKPVSDFFRLSSTASFLELPFSPRKIMNQSKITPEIISGASVFLWWNISGLPSFVCLCPTTFNYFYVKNLPAENSFTHLFILPRISFIRLLNHSLNILWNWYEL